MSSTPPSYAATRVSADTDRALPGEPGFAVAAGRSAVLAALEDVDLEVVERVDLSPRTTRDLDGKLPSNRRGTVRLDVDVPPGDDAVVLLERDGGLLVAPAGEQVDPSERARTRLGPRTARFEIDVQPVPAARRRRRSLEVEPAGPADRTRGLLGDLVQGAAEAIVFQVRRLRGAQDGRQADGGARSTRARGDHRR